MQQRTINYLKMTAGVIAGMESEKPVWSGEKEIADVFAGIVTVNNEIEKKNQGILGIQTTGYTEEKDNLFYDLTTQTFKLCRQLSAYAKLRKDYTLLPLVDLSLTGVQRGMEKEAVDRCAAIVDRAVALLPQLTTFKVNEDQLSDIQQQIKAYNASLNGRTAANGSKIVSGSNISENLSTLREKFDILDDLIEGLIFDEGFIARYKTWRRITDYGIGKTLPNKSS